jgi:hypothetical protein
MDFQLICILIIFLLIFILDKIDKEKFTIKSPLLNSHYDSYKSSFHIGNRQKFGMFPNPLCSSCELVTDEVTPPYLHSNDLGDEQGSLFGKVARKCNSIFSKNYNNLNKPVLVAGRSAGRIRQCRKLI